MGNSMSKMLATAACLAASHLHDAYLGTPTTINDENEIPMDNYEFSRHLTTADGHLTKGTPTSASMKDHVDDEQFADQVRGLNKLLDDDGDEPQPSDPVQAEQPADSGDPTPLLDDDVVPPPRPPPSNLTREVQQQKEFMKEFDNIFSLLQQRLNKEPIKGQSLRYTIVFEIRSFWMATSYFPLQIEVTIKFHGKDLSRHVVGSLCILKNDGKGGHTLEQIAAINGMDIIDGDKDHAQIVIKTEKPFRNDNTKKLQLHRSGLLKQFDGIRLISVDDHDGNPPYLSE